MSCLTASLSLGFCFLKPSSGNLAFNSRNWFSEIPITTKPKTTSPEGDSTRSSVLWAQGIFRNFHEPVEKAIRLDTFPDAKSPGIRRGIRMPSDLAGLPFRSEEREQH